MKEVAGRFVCSVYNVYLLHICTRVLVEFDQYEGGCREGSATYVSEWWWSVVNMKEVEERFVCSTSICYLCARVVVECGHICLLYSK